MDVLCFKEALDGTKGTKFSISLAETLAEAKGSLEKEAFHLLVVDLGLTDSKGIETFLEAKQSSPDVPIVVLSGLDDETLAIQAVRAGA